MMMPSGETKRVVAFRGAVLQMLAVCGDAAALSAQLLQVR